MSRSVLFSMLALLTVPALASPREPVRPLVYGGTASAPVDLGDGTTLLSFGAIFMPGSLRDAPGRLYLHVEGITLEPGSDVEVYLIDPSNPSDGRYNPANYIGSIGSAKGDAKTPTRVTREVHDFEAGGKKYTARSTLRTLSGFALALRVKHGDIKVNRFVLSPEAD